MASPFLTAILSEVRSDPEVARALAWELLPHLPAHPERRRLVTIAEAAPLLRLSETALRKHVQRGNVPSVKIGARRLVDITGVEEAP